MHIDLGAVLSATADPGIDEQHLEALDERVRTAHDRIAQGRTNDEFGYAALNLPETTDVDAIRETVSPVQDAEYVLTVGIGGSALGARTITAALAEDPDRHVVLDNVDPEFVRRTLADLPLSETVMNVVSQSGTTAETLANFLVAREQYHEADVDWTERTIVTTGDGGPLRELADTHDLPTYAVPEGVPGRFSALSAVGLIPPAILDVDVESVVAGGAEVADDLGPSLFETPAYAYGAVSYALEERGASVNAMMPYAERLEAFAEWFAQLWAESLGKEGRGQTPVRALGVTDQHSQLQLYRAGPHDKVVTFVHPGEQSDLSIPDPDHDSLAYLDGIDLGALLDAEYDATLASLPAADRPAIEIQMDRLGPRELGELLYTMEAACILAGELADIETFTQPAVEWSKNTTRSLLRDEDNEQTRMVAGRQEYRIE